MPSYLPDKNRKNCRPRVTTATPGRRTRSSTPLSAASTPSRYRPQPAPDDAGNEDDEDKTPISRPEHTDDSLLSESLAKIFIKQGRYERAYEIISGLNLKFPKKSAYFADQLRFLKKLIINQRRLAELNATPDGNRN